MSTPSLGSEKIRECGGSYIVVNVPRYAGNYSFTHTIQLEGGANLPIINGLIDVETGAILDKKRSGSPRKVKHRVNNYGKDKNQSYKSPFPLG